MTTLVCCVGNSDLALDGRSLTVRNHQGAVQSFRAVTEQLLTQAADALDRLDAPVLRPLLDWAIARLRPQPPALHVVLLATDQEPPHPQDTVFAARLLERWLEHRYAARAHLT
ncbi:MAG: hypothetical protein RMJ05_06120, partial [Thermomicrobium sp.]|nr:hypothetical protein [Thermomicrobium sp.]MDW8006277.1 hypothetical protein [Thermomicrobium sp.]